MSNFYSDEVKVGNYKLWIHNRDNHYGHHVYGYEVMQKREPESVWERIADKLMRYKNKEFSCGVYRKKEDALNLMNKLKKAIEEEGESPNS